jgi:hypothetical protein
MMLVDECDRRELTMEQASRTLEEPADAISRWVSLAVFPGPQKYQKIADFLGVSVYEVGGALALDRLVKHQRDLSR